MSFHHIVWYGLEFLESESLHVCHYVVLMSDEDGLTDRSISVVSMININTVDTAYSNFPSIELLYYLGVF